MTRNPAISLCMPASMASQEVHLWHQPLWPADRLPESLEKLLSPAEQQRAQRLRGEAQRIFVTVRATLRTLLGHYVQQPAASLRVCNNPDGKPFLDAPHPLWFNVTHSGAWALYAVSPAGELGVDLQQMHPADPDTRLRMARRFFSSEESSALGRLPVHQLQEAFFACWTRKEAYIKRHGLSLARLLPHFTVSVEPDQPAALLATPWQPEDLNRCHLQDLPAPTGYRAALALASTHPPALCHHHWPEPDTSHGLPHKSPCLVAQ
ncbi:MAG: 4'-phosphopantetheinyl transferase superfamily protein [Magnetococcus sp. MYC-9]